MVTLQTPVAQLVLDHSECTAVLQRLRIDYCCHGAQSLGDACRRRGLDPSVVLAALQQAVSVRSASNDGDLRTLDTAALLARLERHHAYLREVLPALEPLSAKVARVHGDSEPALLAVRDTLFELAEVLLVHVEDQEREVFPALRAGAAPRELLALGSEPVEIGGLLEKLRDAARGYQVPDWACRSYTTLMRELEALEADVFAHVHLENHVLLPRFAR